MRFLLLAALSLTLVACGSDTAPEPDPGTMEMSSDPAQEAGDPVAAPDGPVNLNTATMAEFEALPGVGERFAHEFDEYRPYTSIEQFRREIGKYVDEAQVAAFEELVFVPVVPNESDAATLMQLPGIDETMAESLIALRPFADEADFLAAVAEATGRPSVAASRYIAR